jgi:hypothetical protein
MEKDGSAHMKLHEDRAMTDVIENRRGLNAALDAKRERLRRIDDAILADLVDFLRSLVPDLNFDPVDFLASWLWRACQYSVDSPQPRCSSERTASWASDGGGYHPDDRSAPFDR